MLRLLVASLPFGVIVAGLNVQLAPVGNPLQERVITAPKKDCGVTDIV
jgi:hypothetical protein